MKKRARPSGNYVPYQRVESRSRPERRTPQASSYAPSLLAYRRATGPKAKCGACFGGYSVNEKRQPLEISHLARRRKIYQ
jgi:hypothetical protein